MSRADRIGNVQDDSAPATRQDLQSVETRLESKIQSVEIRIEHLEKRVDDRFERLSEQMRDMQTELLKAFLPWQEQVRVQFREIESNTSNSIAAVKERMNILERRLSEIEKKLFLEPPAA